MDSALVANISTISQTLEDIVSSRLEVSLFGDMRARPLRHMNYGNQEVRISLPYSNNRS